MKTKTIGRKTVLLICLAAMLLLSAAVLGILTLANSTTVQLTQELTASDEQTYRVTVTYDTESGIPEDAVLSVSELREGDEGYADYVARSTRLTGGSAQKTLLARAFDIRLLSPGTGEEYQPDGTVLVNIELLDTALFGEINVVHFGETEELMAATVSGSAVEFETGGFSVYVVIAHEGDKAVLEPRIEFHFLAPVAEDYSPAVEGGIAYYTSSPYEFNNKANEVQSTLILRDGDSLEAMEAPANTATKFFYGWYTVIRRSGNVGAGSVTYYWPDDTKRMEVGETIAITPTLNGDGSVASMSWTINGVTCSTADVNAVIDEEGCAHVYLAPIYSNYYFVNFHLGAYGSSTAGNIMTRKLIVLGNSQATEVRISDVKSITNDPTHYLFVGWQRYNSDTGNWIAYHTSADDGSEIVTNLPVGAETVDLYPVFVEIRQINYNLGATSNGAEYLPPDYKYVSGAGGVGSDYPITQLKTSSRIGYTFAGWYLEGDPDDSQNGTGTKIAGADGKILSDLTYSEEGSYDGNNGVAFKIENGALYLYTPLDSLGVYARWEKKDTADYKVIIWQQKVTDDKNAADANKKYDYYTHFELTANPNTSPTVSPRTADLDYNFPGFHLGRYNSNVTLDPQGSTVLNVYYDRDLRAINYYYYNITPSVTYYPAYTYTATTGNNGTQYGLVNDQYVQLTYTGGKWNVPEYAYQYQVDNENGTFGKVGDKYYELTPYYVLTSTLTAGNDYLIVNGNTAGNNRYALGHSGTTIARDDVTINTGNAASGNAVFINAADVDATSVWTVSGSYIFQNGTHYLRRNNSNTLQISTTNSNNTWSWDGTNNRLSINNRYLRYYNNTFSLNTATNSVYLFVKSYTYVDDNGATQTYSGDRYSYNYVATGNQIAYNATRFTRSNNTLGNSYHLITWTGLYGQNFAQNGYSWDNVSDYYWREGTTPGSGTGQTFLDAFIQDTNPYNLVTNSARGNFALYHYRQQLDGSYTTSDRETAYLTLGTGNTTFNLTDKFNGFSVSSYNKGTDGFSSTGGSSSGSSTSISSYDNALHVYHTRNKYSLTFMQNYPTTATFNQNGKTEDPTVYTGIYYGASLSGYAGEAAPSVPDDYRFAGWYEDASGTVPFDFNSEMPAANKILYAKWELVKYRIRVDSNGGLCDHINYDDVVHGYRAMLAPTGLGQNGESYNASYATYFNKTATETIEVDQNLRRPYVAITEAEAATRKANGEPVYRYINMQLDENGSYDADLRNSLYILDTPESIEAYYNFFIQRIADTGDGNAANFPRATFEDNYLSTEKYRPVRTGELYVLLGWYEVLADGSLSSAPFDFTKPVDHATTLRALWRLEGGYTLQYTTEYYAPNHDLITADLPTWTDPGVSSGQTYSDQASTNAMQEPTAIRVNSVLSKDYQFLGWQIVQVETVNGIPYYTPLEPDNHIYMAGQPLTVQAKYSDKNMIIHMQAVYEYRGEATRRPSVANLTLDASRDAGNEGYGYIDVTKGSWPSWGYAGASAPGSAVLADNGLPRQILFQNIQSNAAVQLYQYATWRSGEPTGVNFFVHSAGFKLLGFDSDGPDANYIADFVTSDGLVAVGPGTSGVLYAVWEPLVYVNFDNQTHGDLTFSLASESDVTFNVVNRVTGEFERVLDDPDNITVPAGGGLRFAVPYGKGKDITVSGVNTVGSGYELFVSSTISGDFTAQGRTGDPAEVSAAFGDPYAITDVIVEDATGITVTFTEEAAEHILILDDNRPGGQVQEKYFNSTTSEWTQSYVLPNTNTYIGYEFKGWSADPNATVAEFPLPAPTIPDVSAFFGSDKQKTLYAVWVSKAEANTVYVYKTVPQPGDQTLLFDFTVSFTGSFDSNGKTNASSGTVTEANISGNEISRSFTLTDGQYLKIVTEKRTGNNGSGDDRFARIQVTVRKYPLGADEASDAPLEEKVFSWTRSSAGAVNWKSITFTVTETADSYYDTAVQVGDALYPAGDTSENALKAGGSAVTWIDTNGNPNTITNGHGGTAVFTNTRKTANITVKKVLLPSTLAAREFPVAVAFVNSSGETATFEKYTLNPLSYTVTSGSAGYTVHDVPTGAVIRFTETEDSSYRISAAGTTDAGHAPLSDGNSADNIFEFTVEEDATVTFTNELISQKLRVVVQDDEGNPLDSGQFTFPGVFSGTKTSTAAGLVWAGEVYADHTPYVLTELRMPDHAGARYTALQEPVRVTVSGANTDAVALSGGSGYATVSGPGADGYYTITIVNPRMKLISLQKQVGDEDKSGSFLFHVTLTKEGAPVNVGRVYGETGTDSSGAVNFTLVHMQTASIYVPKGVRAEIQEDAGDYTATTTGSYADADGNSENQTFIIESVEADGNVTFENKLKTSEVTVTKVMETDTGEKFNFTVTVTKGGAIANYPVYTDPYDSSKDLRTNASGQVTFTLGHNESVVLTVPHSAMLLLTEEDKNGDYVFSAASTDFTLNTVSSFSRQFVAGKDSGTVTVTNTPARVEISFSKVDSFGEPLPGAEFAVYDSYPHAAAGGVDGRQTLEQNGLDVQTVSSDASGAVTFKLKGGIWYLKELAAPSGYAANDYVYRLTVVDETHYSIQRMSNESTVDTVPDIAAYGIVNTPTGERKAILKKIENSNNAPLSGAKFDILAFDRTVVATGCESASDGVFWVGTLPYGLYYVHETKVPSGMNQGSGYGWWYTVRVDDSGVTFQGMTNEENPVIPGTP